MNTISKTSTQAQQALSYNNNFKPKKTFAKMVTDSLLTSTKSNEFVISASAPSASSTHSSQTSEANQPRLVSVLNRAIKDAFLTAVHGDLMSKESRKKNIIISGLEVVDGTQDADLVGNLLDTELGLYPEISQTR